MKMNIGIYIHKLLLENETVIIPGFGAFVSNYKPAEVNLETDELMPPSKEISFNPQIRNNDGILVGIVAAEEGISHFDALKSIEKERENIIYQLDKGEKIILEETGEIYYDEKHEIQFDPFQDENLLLDSFGLESVSLKNTSEEKEIPESKDDEIQQEEEIDKPVEKTKSETVTPKFDRKNIPDPIVWDKEVQEKEAKSILYPEDDEPKEKKNRKWLLLLLLLPIIVVGVYIVQQISENRMPVYKTQENNVTYKKEDPVPEQEITIPNSTEQDLSIQDSAKQDSTLAVAKDTTIQIEPKTSIEENSETDSPKYYLVSGSFKDEENAKEYMTQLNDKGIETIYLGKHGSFFIVAVGKYNSGKEAVEARREFELKNPDSGLWVLKK